MPPQPDTLSSASSTFFNLTDLANWNNIAGLPISILGLCITIYTFIKVKSISDAKKEERALLTSSLKINNLLENLTYILSCLNDVKTPEVEKACSELARMNIELSTALRILLPTDCRENLISDITVHADNYWTDDFASKMLKQATKEIIVVTWRCTRIFREEILATLLNLLTSNNQITIKIFFISPKCDQHVFATMDKMLSLGSANQMRTQQVGTLGFAIKTIKEMLNNGTIQRNSIQRLKLYELDFFPNLHCVISDDIVTWGINFYMDNKIGSTDLLSKAYISTRRNTSFGNKVFEQISILEKLCHPIDLNKTHYTEEE